MSPRSRSLISLRDLATEDLQALVDRAVTYSQGQPRRWDLLRNRIIGVYFAKTSTRTRTSFTAGALRLGAQVISYGPDDLQIATGETIQDTARVMGGMLDALVIRTAADPAEMREFGRHLPTINAMSADEHPTQAIADLTALALATGSAHGRRVLYIGEGNNTAVALALALPRLGGYLELRTPRGYGVPDDIIDQARLLAGDSGSVRQRHTLDQLPPDVHAVYTTRWQTTGTAKADPNWRSHFRPFTVTEEVMAQCPEAVLMHDLPAHRGDEIVGAVLDGVRSIAFRQAHCKLSAAMAVLEWCVAGRPGIDNSTIP